MLFAHERQAEREAKQREEDKKILKDIEFRYHLLISDAKEKRMDCTVKKLYREYEYIERKLRELGE